MVARPYVQSATAALAVQPCSVELIFLHTTRFHLCYSGGVTSVQLLHKEGEGGGALGSNGVQCMDLTKESMPHWFGNVRALRGSLLEETTTQTNAISK